MLTDQNRLIALDLSQTSGLTELVNEAFTRKVSSISYEGVPLTELILPNSVTTIGEHCFYNCKNLKKFYAPGVTTLKFAALYVCSSLTEITLAEEMETIESLAFGFCYSLTEMSLNARNLGNNIFEYAKELKTIEIGKKVETISSQGFLSSTNTPTQLSEIKVDSENTHFKVIDGLLYSYDGTRLIRCPPAIQKNEIILTNAVTTLDPYAFAGCQNLKNVSIPNVTKIPHSVFLSCPELTTVSMPTVVTIGYMTFYGCPNSVR